MKQEVMNVKKWLMVLALMTMATAAIADTVALQLVGTPYGVIGPYDMKVNGQVVTEMVCGSDVNFITMGESWTAQVYTINNVASNTVYAGISQAAWNEAALFADLLLQHPGNAAIQNDVWASLGLGGGFDVAWLGVVNTFLAGHPGYLTLDQFFIPVDAKYDEGSGYPNGVPQPFIGAPEPSSLMLFGSGLFAAAGLVRRRARI